MPPPTQKPLHPAKSQLPLPKVCVGGLCLRDLRDLRNLSSRPPQRKTSGDYVTRPLERATDFGAARQKCYHQNVGQNN